MTNIKAKKTKPLPFSVLDFKTIANKKFSLEAAKLSFEQNGQGKLVFVPEDIFEALKNIECIPVDILEDVKRAIVFGFGNAIQEAIEYQLNTVYDLHLEHKSGAQIFNGQLTKKNGKVYLWVEVVEFYDSNDDRLQLAYKYNFSNKDYYSDETITKMIKGINKEIDKAIKNKTFPILS